jgi:hypothetical protein
MAAMAEATNSLTNPLHELDEVPCLALTPIASTTSFYTCGHDDANRPARTAVVVRLPALLFMTHAKTAGSQYIYI